MSKLNTEAQVIEGVGFYYTKIQNPSPKFNHEDGNEFVVDLHVDKATAKAWGKEFPKNKPKEMEYDEFVEKFGEGNAIGTDEQYFIKLKKNESYEKDGVRIPIADKYRPRVLQEVNGELEDITFTKLVGNGSKGVAQYEINENKYGKFANLVAIKVEELDEYISKGGDVTEKFSALGKVKSLAENPNAKAQETSVEQGDSQENEEDDQW